MVDVGKYTSPMDSMGNTRHITIKCIRFTKSGLDSTSKRWDLHKVGPYQFWIEL